MKLKRAIAASVLVSAFAAPVAAGPFEAMKLTAMALASAFALSSTCAFGYTVRHKSNVRTHPTHSDATRSVVLHPKYGNPNGNFSGYGSRDVWGHRGAYYGPMIPTGAGGR
jgi:hypothetical protein